MRRILLGLVGVCMLLFVACSQKELSLNFDTYELLVPYEESVKTLEDKGIEYSSTDLEDASKGRTLKVEKYTTVGDEDFTLTLMFPNNIIIGVEKMDLKGEYLTSFSYTAQEVKQNYVDAFIKACNKSFGEATTSTFEDDVATDFEFIAWNLEDYNISLYYTTPKGKTSELSIVYYLNKNQEENIDDYIK